MSLLEKKVQFGKAKNKQYINQLIFINYFMPFLMYSHYKNSIFFNEEISKMMR